MNKKLVLALVFILLIIAVMIFLLSRRYCLLDPGREGIIGQWWTAPTPQGDITFCCPLNSHCL